MSSVAMPQLPEPGQVVRVRGAVWAVTDILEQGLSRSPADEGLASRPGLQHVVVLQSLEEDRLGEELQVVWELEVGHSVVPDQGLPRTIDADGFDDPDTLGAYIDAARWGAVTSADASEFQAPFRSGARLEPYQLEPLRRALDQPRVNLLLADDVGLGKTIEAGLVIEELLLRHRARSVIIVCPPSLSIKWHDEMLEKFGLDFQIVDSAKLAETRRKFGLTANPFRLYPRVIVSMAWLPGVRAQRLLRPVYQQANAAAGPVTARRFGFDVLVVDEAHHVAPAAPTGTGKGRGYAVDSQRTLAVRELAAHCEHRLFLSATPHNGYDESFTALLEMVDSRRFARGAEPDPKALSDVMVRRLKTDILRADEGSGDHHPFQPRSVAPLEYAPDPVETERFEQLETWLKQSARQRGAKSLGIGELLLEKRFLSSPYALGRTLAAYGNARATGAAWDEHDGYFTEVLGIGQSDEEEGLESQPEFTMLRRAKAADPLAAAPAGAVEELKTWALGQQGRANGKLECLTEYLDRVCRSGKRWTGERVVVFTEYADTLIWIKEWLESQGYGPRLAVIQGSTSAEDRELIRARFQAPPDEEKVRVLLATDAAGEGVDLQAHCHRLVNFDIPFNPARLEQRAGRIDRYGQMETPEIYYLSPEAVA
ncbi:MAG: DISARM system SNF2-like helicase DrmD, partial [Bifidobacteriaceae bacterium]|nr:DISARM system SNF2-like helicase DrmD [Bifidobacteriaceae bacterium]